MIDWDAVPDAGEIPAGHYMIFNEVPEVTNCLIHACNYREVGAGTPMYNFVGAMRYSLIKQWCKPQNAGGQSPGVNGGFYIVHAVNPEFARPSKPKRSGAHIAARNVTAEIMTIAEVEELIGRAQRINLKEQKLNTDVSKRQDDVSSFHLHLFYQLTSSVKCGPCHSSTCFV
jgi:hypothetical protein